MNISCGIVGLPNVGKSTLFNALLKKQVADAANYPFTTIEPNVGVVEVPDERLEKLADVIAKEGDSIASLQNDKRGWVDGYPPIIPAIVKFVDIAGLVKGAAQGEGLGNQFLSHIREVDVIVFVLRDFSGDVIRAGSESPETDVEILKSELLLKDLETLNKQSLRSSSFDKLRTAGLKRQETLSRDLKSASGTDPGHAILKTIEGAKSLVEQGKWLGEKLSDEELKKIADLQLLSAKKCIYVVNSDEGDLKKPSLIEGALRLSAKLEEELSSLSEDEQRQYLKELGQKEPGLNILIRKAYETLDLISFFTAGPKEVRAWTVRRGTLASQAAGVIHTDFERGFIAAEVCNFSDLTEVGGWQNAKGKGKVKTVGKTEEIRDGMVVEFKFSV